MGEKKFFRIDVRFRPENVYLVIETIKNTIVMKTKRFIVMMAAGLLLTPLVACGKDKGKEESVMA